MKKILIIFLLMTVGALADNISPSDTVTLVGRTLLSDGGNAQPDSIRIMVYRAGSQVYDTWFNSSDAECYSTDNALVFFDAFSDIDGTGGDGHYTVEVGAYGGGEDIYTYWYYDFTIGGLDVNVSSVDADAIEAGDFDTGAINADALATDAVNEIEDAVHANANDYKADVSGLSTFDASSDSVMTKNPNAYKADVSGLSTFDASSDSVMTKNPNAYKADISGLSTFDYTTDKVTLVDSSAGDISYIANNQDDYKANGFAVPGDAMTLTVAERQAVADTNENRLDLSGKTIGTVTNVSDKDGYTLTTAERQAIADSVANRDMTLTASERGAIEDSIHANADDYKANGFAVPGDAMSLTIAERQAISDSVKNEVGVDSSRTALGDSLRVALGDSCTGGGGSDTTAIKEMMNNNCWGWHYDILSDTSYFADSTHWASYFQKVGGDSTDWPSVAEFWHFNLRGDSANYGDSTASYFLRALRAIGLASPYDAGGDSAALELMRAFNKSSSDNAHLYLENYDDFKGSGTGATAQEVWEYATRGLTTADNITSTGGTILLNADGDVRVYNNEDKTEYSLTQNFPDNFEDLSITPSTGLVDINDKTEFKLASDGLNGVTQTSGGIILAQNGLDNDTSFTQLQNKVNTNLDETISGIDDNPWDNPDSDSGLGMGNWFANWWHDIDDDSSGGGGSDTTAIKEMAYNNFWGWNLPWDTSFAEGSIGDSLSTPSYVQGEAGNASAIAHAVAETLITGRGLATFGNGQYACSTYVFTSADTTAIANTWLTIRAVNGSSILARIQTNDNGLAIAHLNTGDHSYSAFNLNYIFNQIDTITISGNQTDTIWGSIYSPTAPSADMCMVTFLVNPANYDTLAGTIFEWQLKDSIGNDIPLSTQITYGSGLNTILVPTIVQADTTSSSVFEVPLFPNSSLSPNWTKYWMKIRWPNGDITVIDTVTVPDTTNYNPFAP